MADLIICRKVTILPSYLFPSFELILIRNYGIMYVAIVVMRKVFIITILWIEISIFVDKCTIKFNICHLASFVHQLSKSFVVLFNNKLLL